MKYFVISDTHMNHQRIQLPKEHVDAVFHCGDFCEVDFSLSFHDPKQIVRMKEQMSDFLLWYGKINADRKILIAGNHDLLAGGPSLESFENICKYNGVEFIHKKSIEVCGFKVYGDSGYLHIDNNFGNYGYFLEEDYWQNIPEDTAILLTHTPTNLPGLGGHADYGCPELLEKIHDLGCLRLHLCGHIHEGRGDYRLGDVEIINVACEMSPKVREITK